MKNLKFIALEKETMCGYPCQRDMKLRYSREGQRHIAVGAILIRRRKVLLIRRSVSDCSQAGMRSFVSYDRRNSALSLVFLVRTFSGRVRINEESSAFAWVGEDELRRYNLIPDVRADVSRAL